MARNPLSSIDDTLKDTLDAAWDRLPKFSLVEDVEVPIYVIHHSRGAEDYELICDFEQFMTESQSGILKRPALRVWAGRQDFEKHLFARRLREDFTQQFNVLRMALQEEKKRVNWSLPSLGDVILWGLSLGSEVVGSILLWLATEQGRVAIERISQIFRRPAFDQGVRDGSAEEKLEALIEEKKEVIDAGLARLEIAIHRDLYLRAWRGQRPGPITGMDREAWPLPDFVRERMND